MVKVYQNKFCLIGLCSFTVFLSLSATALLITRLSASDGKPASIIEQGRVVYEQNCAICHETSGDGRGIAQMMLLTKPRDFRQGIFKFRSTPTGSLPTDEDLFQTVSTGLQGTGMVAQDHLRETERRAVVEYLKTFSERFRKQTAQASIHIPEPPPRSRELVEQGRKLFQEAGCFTCHGVEGKGDGPSASELKDSWGRPSRPGDLTRPLKRGSKSKSIYLTLATGLDGTPMPSYRDALSDNDLWALVYYVASLNSGIPSELQMREERAGKMVIMMHGRGGMMHRRPMMR
ncbi:MAG: c-type cytochrome [Deltaproteobacteria bacterium]|nr:c-type cytochrome [Deltaproteobacteria bacterium]